MTVKREEISFRCPLCKRGFKAKRIAKHVKEFHPELDKDRFIDLLGQAEKAGTQVVFSRTVEIQGVDPSRSTVFSRGDLSSTRWISVVNGGAIGQGKRK